MHYDELEQNDVHGLNGGLELNDGLNDELEQNDVHDEVKNDERMWYGG